jgi:hypothetical protein
MQEMQPGIDYRCVSWLPDRYLFGRDGSAWSRSGRGSRWRRLRSYREDSGRLYIYICDNRKHRKVGLAASVLSAFGDPRPIGMEVFYRDGDRSNTALSNLTWSPRGTGQIGTRHIDPERIRGSRNAAAKLDEAKVEEAKLLYSQGHPVAALAELFSVSAGAIHNALTGRKWSHLGRPAEMRTPGKSGSLNHFSKLDEIDVTEIRGALASGEAHTVIAARFGVSPTTIGRIAAGKIWKGVG